MTLVPKLVREVPEDADVLGVPVFVGEESGPGAELDADFLTARGFTGELGETLALPADDGTVVVAIGMGSRDKVDAEVIRRAAAGLVKASWKARRVATTLLAAAPQGLDAVRAAQALAEGAVLASYAFSRYKTKAKPCEIESLGVVGRGGARVESALARGAQIASVVNRARDLVNTPAADLTPSNLAEMAEQIAKEHGLALTVWDEEAAASDGLGGLLGVARGSAQEARMIRLVYDPPGARTSVAVVGKGITFDSGGLSLKPADGMETMKTDMSGAAAVLGVMSALAPLGAKVRVVGIIPATENMPGGRAIKPGDVLKIRNGKTVEVLNTDAEGRLVLADGLSLAAEAGVDAIIDLATLTGACMVALGKDISGLMGNNDQWISQVRDAAGRAGEKVWPLPLPPEYRKQIDSDVADIKNVAGRHGGALTAGLFLAEFVGDVPWVHLDIAGPARADNDDGYIPKGGTGVGIRTVLEAIGSFRRPVATAG